MDGVAAAVLRLVAQSFARMVHAIFAAGSGRKVHKAQNISHDQSGACVSRYSPTAEAQAGAGEVLVGEEAAVGRRFTADLSIEALAQRLQRHRRRDQMSSPQGLRK